MSVCRREGARKDKGPTDAVRGVGIREELVKGVAFCRRCNTCSTNIKG